MKKIMALLAALVIVFSFAGCTQNSEEETTSDMVSETQENSENTTSRNDESTQAADNNQGGTSSETTKAATTKTTTAQKPTEAKKEEPATKRKIKLNVKLPYYNGLKTNIKIEYKLSKDKKYKELTEDNEQVVLDKMKTQSYDIKENLTGDVDVRVTLDGVELLETNFVVKANERESTIELVTGNEMLEGGFD